MVTLSRICRRLRFVPVLFFVPLLSFILVSCESTGLGPATDTPRGEANGNVSRPGQLTAAEWNDLEEWAFWRDLVQSRWDSMQQRWGYSTLGMIPVVLTSGGKPAVDVPVALVASSGATLWSARTDARGRAWLFDGMFGPPSGSGLRIVVPSLADTVIDAPASNEQVAAVRLDLPSAPEPQSVVDVMFMIDVTGSMGDELEYVKSELTDVMRRVKKDNPEISLRLSVNVYRDRGDDYVVRPFDFTTSVETAVAQLAEQSAGGGGDYEEAVDEALVNGVDEHEWSASARARLLFLVLDAPPHDDEQMISDIRSATRSAAEKGIRVIPVVASGANKELEALMRFIGIGTGGTYVFITDDSGIGNDHLEPTVGEYQIEYLNDLLVRVIGEYAKG